MQSPLEQRELDAIRYNTDGRRFRLEIEGEVLRLVANYSLNLVIERVVVFLIAISGLLELLIPFTFDAGWILQAIFLGVLIGFPSLMFALAKWPKYHHAVTWDFDRNLNMLQINKRNFVPLSDISNLIAFQRGKSRLLLALEFKNGRRFFIGRWCFATKEFAWREDAQTIANFLNVPLHIPEV